MAAYRGHFGEFQEAGASLTAISVDPPERSRKLARSLDLPFSILCDTDRRVVTEWNLLNTKERGGIAFPAIWIIDRDCKVLFRSVDRTAARVRVDPVLAALRGELGTQPAPRRSAVLPDPGTAFRTITSMVSGLFKRRAG